MKRGSLVFCAVLFAGMLGAPTLSSAQAPGTPRMIGEAKAPTLEALRAEIEALRAPQVAWRQIPWKSCLLEGLKESRATKKPLILWIFIDRPVDDARC